ncbi:MAG: NAD(P)H-quinone oxidoreductase [Hoeflea sp.]|uniref:NAD(P)H-quinone oxidoreductase n=1 Tax=Hoeflea sp. TaxID=1940281 RepID=UPI001DE33DC4|nr:NAD(P)H-quinone oxidoreductase [Hoeflea sp.]MBU4528270.1 NAD(P)H-quinone oxidoreductase [Alphaproteobacteria bacterium]MBU4543866.1 NAD(P)H-quinone oxidoreductase [Alphaproteobacteria bacterium]MBU4548507.1 NAD(P)H-quinone oxidoreductase [Alphaproteobacteria bacterium]MBV1722586.1 NAD(P)H-quinone oxidoreductase [Hoeflea sp.]MBV1762255.1 NAD(P)H-quinone oxidoreductase [Hoeflea sp.]
MRAIEIREPGGPEVLTLTTREKPVPSETQLLVKVLAAGINRPDCLQRQGAYPPPPGASDIPGLEIAGEVTAVGSGVSRFKPGARVCALVPGGGYAEFCCVDETNALPAPGSLTMTEAAAIPETFFTVWHNVFQRGALKSGETFLVHGGTSGIGTTAIQLAKAFGARVLATAGSEVKCAAMRELGADVAINYHESDFVEAVATATDGKGADLILDMVGGDYINRNYKAAAIEGRIVQIAFLKGRKAEVDFSLLMMKRLTHTGSTLRARDIAFKATIAEELRQHVWPLLSERKVLPVMDSIFPMDQASAAHQRMEDGDHIGKIVLDMG